MPVDDALVWCKACEPAWAFEPRLTAELSARWPDRVTEVLACDVVRGWLLLGDAGRPIGDRGNQPEAWLEVLPRYAELQRGEVVHAEDHIAHGVPDLRVESLPEHYDQMLRTELPVGEDEITRLREFEARFAELSGELGAAGIPPSIQHDDLHHMNVYDAGGHLRVVDWGDSSVAHPFMSLVVTFRFLEEINRLSPDDPMYDRLRDAYLEPWGSGLVDVFDLALRVGIFAHAIASVRARAALPTAARGGFDVDFRTILRRAVARTVG